MVLEIVTNFCLTWKPILIRWKAFPTTVLKQTDFDGQFEYFNIIPVRFEKGNSAEVTIFPNPVQQGKNITISGISSKQEILVVIRDMQGKEFYSKIYLNINKNGFIGDPIDNEIPKGIHIVIATSENSIYSKKLVIE